MTTPEFQRASRAEWEAVNLRLTAFAYQVDPVPAAAGTWARVVGSEPDKQTSRPKTGELAEEGAFQTGVLNFNTQPGRLEWRLSPAQQQNLIPFTIPTLSSVENVLEPFREITSRWLSELTIPIRRLAFGAQFVLPAESREHSYRRLALYLPAINLDPKSEDFTYQINRPRNSVILPDIKVNRLSKWAGVVFRITSVVSDLTELLTDVNTLNASYFCIVDEDINTAAERKEPLPQDNLLALYDELIANGMELLTEGDVP